MAPQPVGERLGPGRLGEGVVGGTQGSDKDLRLPDLTGAAVDDGYSGPAVIDKALLTGSMVLAHGAFLLAAPMPVAITELGIAVAAVRILLGVLFPQQLLGHVGPLEFQMYDWPVRHLVAAGGAGIGGRVEQDRESVVIQIVGQWPAQFQGSGLGQQLRNAADTDLGAATDLANG